MRWVEALSRRRRPRWKAPRGYHTLFSIRGDPLLDDGEKRAELYARVFSTADGRMILGDILARAGLGRADYEPGVARDDAIFFSGVKHCALDIARMAGLETGAIGRALVNGRLEDMAHASDETDSDDEAPAAEDADE
jgi:hypothetical protein